MLTPNFWELACNLLYVAAFLLSVWGFVYFKKKRPVMLRIAGQTFSVITASLFGFLILLLICWKLLGCDHGDMTSAALYSPDHTRAVFLETFDAGAMGGGTSAELYSHYGFSKTLIYVGNWRSLEEQNVHWLSNSELKIEYYSDTAPEMCQSTKTVRVICEPQP
jgi:hypothetical protein